MAMQDENYLPAIQQTGVQISNQNAGAMLLAQMSDEEFKANLAMFKRGQERIATIHREIMEEGVDYGVIPGTKNPTLYKPGAEKLGAFYHLAADFHSVKTTCNDGTAPTISYETKCFLHLGDLNGPIVAIGEGTANSWERKHRYRSAERACPECGCIGSIIKGKEQYERDERFKGGFICFDKKGGCGAKFTKDDKRITQQQLRDIDNPDPYDLDNTLLKVAEKRAYVGGMLRGTATSGRFIQEVDDIAELNQEQLAQIAVKGEVAPSPGAKPAGVADALYSRICGLYQQAHELGLTIPEDAIKPDMTAGIITGMTNDLQKRLDAHFRAQNNGKSAQEVLSV